MKIVITGGSGFLGQAIGLHFAQQGFEVHSIARSLGTPTPGVTAHRWDARTLGDWAAVFEGADLVINMAGKSVNCRYTPENKREIMDSRVRTTRLVGEAIARCAKPPKAWFNSSSATIYADTRGHNMANGESSQRLGHDFSMNVCRAWEESFWEMPTPSATRKIVLRSAIVLGGDGGALPVMARLARQGLGGTQGSGEQYFSWLHIVDFLRILDFLLRREDIRGIVNCAAPNPLVNRDFMRLLRQTVGAPFGLRTPVWALRFGARFILKTEVELVLKSRKVVPERLLREGFSFCFPTVQAALSDLLVKKNPLPVETLRPTPVH